jgi:hypothetical protein
MMANILAGEVEKLLLMSSFFFLALKNKKD